VIHTSTIDRAAIADEDTALAEVAARLQQEIEALDWVTAEQKVTRPSPGDDYQVNG
jgi:hypothetical protein